MYCLLIVYSETAAVIAVSGFIAVKRIEKPIQQTIHCIKIILYEFSSIAFRAVIVLMCEWHVFN